MKYCPKCQKTYEDETLSFCLNDGMTLVNSDPQAETLEIQANSPITPQTSSNVVELINEKVRLNLGDYYDLEAQFRTMRITFKGIVEKVFSSYWGSDKKEFAAQLHISTGGGLVFGGHDTVKTDTNEFLIPVRTSDQEEPRSVYYFYSRDNQTVFFRVFVGHLNQHAKQAELDVVYLRCSRYD